MKRILQYTLLLCLLYITSFKAQTAGNVVYSLNGFQLPESNYQLPLQQYTPYKSVMKIKGLANVKADSYTAIFSVKQIGKSAEEANAILDERIQSALVNIRNKPGVEVYIDMISFVPVYAFEEQKKIFSKRTFTEVPSGFEIIKNIHISYSHYTVLNDLITSLAKQEIYDLVRVDYFSKDVDKKKEELKAKAMAQMNGKIEKFKEIIGENFTENKKQLIDGFKILLPVEQYQSYFAYSSSFVDQDRFGNVKRTSKPQTLYYQPVLDKEFDFVINPAILEPVIQIIYEIGLYVYQDDTQPHNRYYLLDSNSKIQEIKLKN